MTTLREAAQQALEALEVATNCLDGYYIPRGKTTLPEIEDAITALRAALAEPQEPDSPERRCGGPGCDMTCCQPVQEPVGAVLVNRESREGVMFYSVDMIPDPSTLKDRFELVPVYAAPPQRKPEPNSDYERGFVDGMSEQARRSVDKAVNAMTKCKPLAEEEIARLVTNDMVKFARAIERAHNITGDNT